ncbi:MAG TPA: hypothetical protein VIA06_04915 [Candidatus Dormibacteraeota bacterium]|nr:hypothetical protein [Candidatus Dormibacteraeota bacterium]
MLRLSSVRAHAVRSLAGLIAAAALLLLVSAPAGAEGNLPANQRSDVYSSRTLDVVPHSWSTLDRTRLGLLTVNHVTEIPARRQVTLDVLIFNNPSACLGNGIPGLSPCGAADMTAGGPAGFVRLTGPTLRTTPSGALTMPAWIASRQITNPLGAELILSFDIEGCGTGLACADDLTVHNPGS